MDWPASSITMRPLTDLNPYENNPRTHGTQQIEQLMSSIEEFGFTVPVLVDESGMILAGHGRVMAARLLQLEEVPVMTATGWTEEQKRAYVIADNKLAEGSEWDHDLLRLELTDLLDSDFEVEATGFDQLAIDDILAGSDPFLTGGASGGDDAGAGGEGGDDGEATQYSRKVDSPVYEVQGERPDESELVDRTRTVELLADIEDLDAPADVKDFLRYAAERHGRFNYSKIAEYYAHAPAEVQRLMEDSALVIIDFDRAIELGYVRLVGKLAVLAEEDASKNYTPEYGTLIDEEAADAEVVAE